MKKLLERLIIFRSVLKVLAFLSQRNYLNRLTQFLTTQSAVLNVALNKPGRAHTTQTLAQKWQQMMPPDGKELFPITAVDDRTAYVEIHLHCPLRGTGNKQACHRLMNYDRKLMEKTGGQLIVLESQSYSGKPYCRLAIRKKGDDVHDLTPYGAPPPDNQ